MTAIINDQEKLFAEFLQANNIAWDEQNKKQYEKFGDFYFPNENIMIELKSLQETEISKILTKLQVGYVGAVPFRDSYSPIENHLSDANQKASRAQNNDRYKDSVFITLLSIVGGYDLNVRLFFGNLQGAKFLNYPLIPYNGEFMNDEAKEYYIKDKADDNDLLKDIDYIGILRKYGDFSKWKIELIEKPNYTERNINKETALGKFIDIWRPKFI